MPAFTHTRPLLPPSIFSSLPVALLTEEGDADLYASTETQTPSYSDNMLYSASCGLDLIVMAAREGVESQRVYISVVGHSHHAESRYKLAIISTTPQDIAKYQVSNTLWKILMLCQQTLLCC